MTSRHKVHITLQGKGGVGKSLVASLIAQYYQSRGESISCLDADPVNQTLFSYKAFEVTTIQLMEGTRLNERGFDTMMETILTSPCPLVIDNGASSFIPLANYLLENDAFTMLSNHNKDVVVHIVIAGGQAMLDTLQGFDMLAAKLPKSSTMVLWLNSFFGAIETDGIGFESTQVYNTHKDKVHALIHLPKPSVDTFGKDIGLMLDKRLTFQEAIHSPLFSLMSKQRLAMIKRQIFDQLTPALA